MSIQRAVAAAFFSVVIVAVLATIIYTDHISTSTTTSVYVLARDVPAGQIVAQDDFVQQQVHADANEFKTAEVRPLDQLLGQTRYLLNLHSGDIIRTDDLADAQQKGEVPVILNGAGSTTFVAGERIDIYAFFNGQAALVTGGQGVTVVSAAGNSVIIAVPPQDAGYWVTLAFAKPDMLATRAGAALPTAQNALTESVALCALSGNPAICAGVTTAPGGRAPAP